MKIEKLATLTFALITMLGSGACSKVEQAAPTSAPQSTASADVFVQLFEWRWQDVATECENFLGPAGFAAVQVSPAQEHIEGPEWWTRYQPVSYKIESRSGTREEFADMVQRCKDAGVDVYADALMNHMATIGNGVGVAGSSYSEFSYPVPYAVDDFHHCGRYDDDLIRDYQDLWEVQNCSLSHLADLDTGKPTVQRKIAAYLNDLLSLGVAGLRLDAAKHMPYEDIRAILELVDGDPIIYQEVIDRGGEPIDAGAYLGNGKVTEFKYPMAIVEAFEMGNLASLSEFDTQPGYLPAERAIVFVDNHDIQRGHAGAGEVINYKDGARYDIAVAFMLAHPYGYPMVMSSYDFGDGDQGPPASSPSDAASGCNKEWICEHRRAAIANMVKFRQETAGAGVNNWQLVGDTVLSFGRGDKGHLVINNGEQAIEISVPSNMPPGQYCDVISGAVSEPGCTGLSVNVGDDGIIELSLEPLSMVAIHHGATLASNTELPSTLVPTLANDYKTDEFVPQWAKSAIWYQIFPDRFRNGDSSNDPKVSDLIGADPATPPKEWRIHPWGSDWYELQDYEKANGEPGLWNHIARRRYGGDLQGIIDKLDYIKELGANAIYLNPVFDSPSSHKYDGASYHHIDPNFGPSPDADRALMATENPLDVESWVWTEADKLALKLIEEAHKRDIKIIFDGVFNHMGINSFAFRNLKKHQQDSPYKDWFTVKSFDDPVSGTTFDYEGWFGVKSLPEFKEDEMGLVSGPREYVFNATRRWMNPKGEGIENGIDGWRLDVAYNVHHNFWKAWRKLVKSINPDAYLTAEIVDTPDKVRPYLLGDEFDGEMNYNFAFTAAEFFFHTNEDAIGASEFDKKLKDLRDSYPEGVAYVTQNLFGSHDSNRIGSHIVNRNIGNMRDWGTYFGLSQAANTPEYDVSKPQADDLRLQKLFAIFQMTYVGAPMIYYGDEVGMWGANDPDCRKPMLWPDISYEDEVYLVNGDKRPADNVSINENLKAHYQSLMKIRNENSALATGSFDSVLIDNDRSLYGFVRADTDQAITIILNNSREAQEIEISVPTMRKSTSVTDLLTTRSYVRKNGRVGITLPAKSGVILTED